MAQGDETLKGTRQLWLYNPENFSPEQVEEFSALKDLHLKVARAWAAKELFSQFWEYREEGWARRFFKDWFGWVSRSQLKPVVEAALSSFKLALIFEGPLLLRLVVVMKRRCWRAQVLRQCSL